MKTFNTSQRAIKAFLKAAKKGHLSPLNVERIISAEPEDLSSLIPMLRDVDPWVRKCSAEVMGRCRHGDKPALIEAALIEKDRDVLMNMIRDLHQTREGLEKLSEMLCSDDHVLREEIIRMYREADQTDCLLILLCNEDDEVAMRIKRYMMKKRED